MRISDWSSDVCSSDLRSMSQSERAQGAQAHPQLLEEFGGAYSAPQASYVTSVGRKIAVQSDLANAPTDYTITLLNSPVMNAFAIPGGYVYVTRQLLGLMNDEAEQIGRASCRDRGVQKVEIPGVAVYLKKQKRTK